MFLQLHLLTTFPPHNVNRDEDGRPKTVAFGGTLRGRISSQAKKRALRYAPHFEGLQRSVRTREAGILAFVSLMLGRMVDDPTRRPAAFRAALEELLAASKLDEAREADAIRAAIAINAALGAGEGVTKIKKLKPDMDSVRKFRDGILKLRKGEEADAESELALPGNERIRKILAGLRSEQGLVVGTSEMAALRDLLRSVVAGQLDVDGFVERVKDGLLSREAIDEDTALFGRMVAAKPQFNIEAAAAVSHALTTHAFAVEGDYFSAGEELNVLGGTGAAITSYGFLGTGVYYQYAVLDVAHLRSGLGDDLKRTHAAIDALLAGLVHAQPKGKRNAFGSDVAASFVLCDRGSVPATNLAGAFLEPVRPVDGNGDLMLRSIERLEAFHRTLKSAYGLANETLAFVAHPSRRRGNTPSAGEAWTFQELQDFARAAAAA